MKEFTRQILVSLAKHYGKLIIGDDALNLIFSHVADTTDQKIGQLLQQNPILKQLLKATEEADKLFKENCTDREIVSAMIMLPLAGTDSLENALIQLPTQLDERHLQKVITDLFTNSFVNLSEVQLNEAIKIYTSCLYKALIICVPDFQGILTGKTILDIQNNLDSLIQAHDNVFVSCNEFITTQENRSRLPTSTKFLGRDKEIQQAISHINDGARIFVIDGDPGVGKTRFSIELAQIIQSNHSIGTYEIKCLLDGSGNLRSDIEVALHNKLQRYIIIVDDANRVDQISTLTTFLVDPKRVTGSLILVTVRSYDAKLAIDKLSQNFEGIGRLSLGQLSNQTIDDIIKEAPYNFDQVSREQVVKVADGNPRMAAIVAVTIQKKGIISSSEMPVLYQSYFESVFTELATSLDQKLTRKKLLAIISALKRIYFKNDEFIDILTNVIGNSSSDQTKDDLIYLRDSEILDELPYYGIAKVFNDSIAEYIVYRLFFDDQYASLDYKQEVVDRFSEFPHKPIFETIVALCTSGYQSTRLSNFVLGQLDSVKSILYSEDDTTNITQMLEYIRTLAQCDARETFNLIEEYSYRYEISNFLPHQVRLIADILHLTLCTKHSRSLNIPVMTLLHQYFLKHPQECDVQEKIVKLFNYVVVPIPGNKFLYPYSTWHQPLLAEAEKWMNDSKSSEAIALYIEILQKICSSVIEQEYNDYIDSNKYILSSGSLPPSTPLKELHKKAFSLLAVLYQHKRTTPENKRMIILTFIRPFGWSIQGMRPSAEMMRYDAEKLFPICKKLALNEANLALLYEFDDIFRRLNEYLQGKQAEEIRERLLNENQELMIYHKLHYNHWVRKEDADGKLNFSNKRETQIEAEKNKFLDSLIKNYAAKDVSPLVDLLVRMQAYSELEQNNNVPLVSHWIEKILQGYPEKGKAILEIISSNDHPLFFYAFVLYRYLAANDVDIRRNYANKWITSDDIAETKNLARNFPTWSNNLEMADLDILEKLLAMNDYVINEALVGKFIGFQDSAPDRVAEILLKLSQHVSQRGYLELLSRLIPDRHYASYQLYESHPEMFRRIVFLSTCFETYHDNAKWQIAQCLELLCNKDLNPLFEYFDARYQYVQRNGYHFYNLLPYHFQLHFVQQHPDYGEFLANVLKQMKVDNRSSYWIEVLNVVLFDQNLIGLEDHQPEFDATVEEVFLSWVKGSEDQCKVVYEIMLQVDPSDSWLRLVESIIERIEISRPWWDSLTGTLQGYQPTPHHYGQRVEMIQNYLNKTQSSNMTRFLEYAISKIEDQISDSRSRIAEQSILGIF